MRLRGTITYLDGRTEDFETGSAALADWELYALRHDYPIGNAAPPMLSMLVIAWTKLGNGAGFETWREEVDDVDFDTEAVAAAVPPTLPDPSSG